MSGKMHRPGKRLEPSREQRGDFVKRRHEERRRQSPVATEADEVDRGDEMFLRERRDVTRPPARRTAQAVDQRYRRPRARAALEERVRKELEAAVQ